jgi:nucleotide-binding universal stress UspA family protein
VKTVLALIDFSDATPAVLKVANDLSRAFHARLVLLHVTTPVADFEADAPGSGMDGGGGATDGAAADGGGDTPWPGLADAPSPANAAATQQREHALNVLETECRAIGVETTSLILPARTPARTPVRTILREADRLRPAWVVVGSHGHGALYELLLGSVSTAIVRRSACPVVVVPARPADGT